MAEVTPATLKAYMVARLQEAMLCGKYKPGERLNESLIAREFGISRIPVREALLQLRASGLVVSHQGKGMFVTLLEEEDTQKINSLRLILETEALKLARARVTPQVQSALTALVNEMAAWNGDLVEAAALDLSFHRTVWAAAGNDYLTRALEPLATVLFAYKVREPLSVERCQRLLDHHRVLLDVVLGRTQQEPQVALLLHLRMAYNEPERFSSLAESSERPGVATCEGGERFVSQS